ncbi:MAG TPA: PepSY domain-containing protein [Gemmatales bacterium]|nr:PepSY domain-containing protein [Gemmatales bacterium]HMP60002.1 PepSY domain-containing protein [Gemmatales bacterium]
MAAPCRTAAVQGKSVAINMRVWMRQGHRWGAVVVAAPFLLVLVTGLLLQVKKEWSWVQPPTQRGQGKEPAVSMAMLLAAARSQPQAGVTGWSDIDRIDIQPKRGLVKIQTFSRWEIQVDAQTGAVLQTAYRRSDLIESLHDGSWFGDSAKLWIFLPVAFVVLGLWLTGIYLFFLPYTVRWRRWRKRQQHAGRSTEPPSSPEPRGESRV